MNEVLEALEKITWLIVFTGFSTLLALSVGFGAVVLAVKKLEEILKAKVRP